MILHDTCFTTRYVYFPALMTFLPMLLMKLFLCYLLTTRRRRIPTCTRATGGPGLLSLTLTYERLLYGLDCMITSIASLR